MVNTKGRGDVERCLCEIVGSCGQEMARMDRDEQAFDRDERVKYNSYLLLPLSGMDEIGAALDERYGMGVQKDKTR